MQGILDKARKIFYKDPNVIGVGIGPRRVNNEIRPKENAILVYVAEKIAEDDIHAAYKIPEKFMGLRTDVVDALSYSHSPVAKTVTEHVISDDMRNIDWGRLHTLHMPNASLVQNQIGKVRDFGDVCVVEDDGTFVKIKQDGTMWIDYLEPYRLFRTLHGDEYDFITFFTDGGFPYSTSFSVGIHNDVQGIGYGSADNREYWRSKRLQQFHVIRTQHFLYWRQTMLQEFGHRWGCYANYKDPMSGETKTDHRLSWSLSHWSDELDDDKSPMDYNNYEWTELPNGQFRRVTLTSDQHGYSELDLYLMGLIDPNDIGEFKILRDLQPVSGSITDFTANPVILNIQNFINQEGVRNPPSINSPHYWRQAFIILTKDIDQVQPFVNVVDSLRMRWKNDFIEATLGIAKIDTFLSTLFRLTRVPNVIGLGGYYSDSDQHQHAIVVTANNVNEVWWNTSHGEQGALTQWHAHNINNSFFSLPHWEGTLVMDIPSSIVAVTAYYSKDDQYQQVIVGTTSGLVREIYWNPAIGGEIGEGNLLTNFGTNNILSISGYFAIDGQRHHVFVGTKNGKVHEIWWKSGQTGIEGHGDLPISFGANTIVSISGYFSTDDFRHHVIVGTTAGKIHEMWWKEGQTGIEGHGDLPITFPSGSIVSVTGYWADIDQRHHVFVGTKNGKVHEIWWKSGQTGIEGNNILIEFPSGTLVSIAGYYAENDGRQHLIIATKDGNIHDYSLTFHL